MVLYQMLKTTRLIPVVVVGSSIGLNIVNNKNNSSNSSNNNSRPHCYIDKYISYADANVDHHDYSGVAIISGTSSTILSNAVASHLGNQ